MLRKHICMGQLPDKDAWPLGSHRQRHGRQGCAESRELADMCMRMRRFGDALGAADCERLLAELRQTRLWHCCAHGRPTIVPLVDLGVLQRVIATRRSAAL